MHGYIKIFVDEVQFKNLQNCISGWGYLKGNEYWNIEVYVPFEYVSKEGNKIEW